MIEQAHAKINLCLDVVKRREDGYHILDMIMLPLALHDVLEVELANEDYFESNDDSVPFDKHHTVIKAYELMKEHFNLDIHVHVKLVKNIPSQAGLAGGSSDGAAMMRAIKQLCKLEVSDEELAQLSLKVGADVPFCYMQKPAQVKGIGEELTTFSFDYDPYVLLVKPNVGVSTKDAYQTLDLANCDHCNSDLVKEALIKHDLEKIAELVKNSLENSAFKLVEELADLKQAIKEQGLEVVLMSGSGSTIFALSEDENKVKQVANNFAKQGYFTCITRFMHK